jgi:hypothetical protein
MIRRGVWQVVPKPPATFGAVRVRFRGNRSFWDYANSRRTMLRASWIFASASEWERILGSIQTSIATHDRREEKCTQQDHACAETA